MRCQHFEQRSKREYRAPGHELPIGRMDCAKNPRRGNRSYLCRKKALPLSCLNEYNVGFQFPNRLTFHHTQENSDVFWSMSEKSAELLQEQMQRTGQTSNTHSGSFRHVVSFIISLLLSKMLILHSLTKSYI